jgi:hypothetical protein
MKKGGRIAPSACTPTLYGANGHVTGASLSTPCRRTAQLDTVQLTLRHGWRPKIGPVWRTKSLNANELLAMVATRNFYAVTKDIGQGAVPMFGWFKSERRECRKKVKQDRRHLEERTRRFLKSYLDADQTRKPQFYRAVEDISKKCQPAETTSQPDKGDRRFAEATSQAALQMVLDRVGRFSTDDKVDDFVTDACATVAMAYRHAAGVYVGDEKMKKLGTAAVHLLTMATLYIPAEKE